MDIRYGPFEWDSDKEVANVRKHGVDFAAAAFQDPGRRIFIDSKHSQDEERHFCIGEVAGRVLTVRFVLRGERIRVLGAGFWRKGRRYYEQAA